MGGTIWLDDMLPWATGGIVLFGFLAWVFHGEAEVEEIGGQLLRLLAALVVGVLLCGLALLGFLPPATFPVLFILYPAGVLGALAGAIAGAIRHR
ncbi:hypothetical protein K1T73_12550 [Roseovarius sp. SCSIO 43702]|uniref:hypothetical protein n=1 Tax=Roseovarius sp. SCSIO 43702 TaxID=2823043 RepID=UPI001C739D8B|nr:hypothetical protein [Roseovarius sp. SCSIO 43702]QYX55896.1 hypothetical protein K1T73_12550 [Roseovarius sp. SCSIO 43702]